MRLLEYFGLWSPGLPELTEDEAEQQLYPRREVPDDFLVAVDPQDFPTVEHERPVPATDSGP